MDSCNQLTIKHNLSSLEENLLSCDKCERHFSKACNLRTHLLSHKRVKSFACNNCDKKIYKPSYLRIHMFPHTGEKPFHCNKCDKVFSHASNLRTHKLSHTRISNFLASSVTRHFISRVTSMCIWPTILGRSHMQETTGRSNMLAGYVTRLSSHLFNSNNTRFPIQEKSHLCAKSATRFSLGQVV